MSKDTQCEPMATPQAVGEDGLTRAMSGGVSGIWITAPAEQEWIAVAVIDRAGATVRLAQRVKVRPGESFAGYEDELTCEPRQHPPPDGDYDVPSGGHAVWLKHLQDIAAKLAQDGRPASAEQVLDRAKLVRIDYSAEENYSAGLEIARKVLGGDVPPTEGEACPACLAAPICTRCGVEGEARLTAVEGERRAVDLAAIRASAGLNSARGRPHVSEQLDTMADEIEALRAEVATAHAAGVAEGWARGETERARLRRVVRAAAWELWERDASMAEEIAAAIGETTKYPATKPSDGDALPDLIAEARAAGVAEERARWEAKEAALVAKLEAKVASLTELATTCERDGFPATEEHATSKAEGVRVALAALR